MNDYKWKNVGNADNPEYAAIGHPIGYHKGGECWQDSAGCIVGSRDLPWISDFKMRNGSYCYVGCFRTWREAREAAVVAYENHWRGAK